MTAVKTPKASPTATPEAVMPAAVEQGTEHDAEMETLVSRAEQEFKRNEVQLVDLIDGNTRGVLTLFPYVPRQLEPGKTYPVMTGQLATRRASIRVSAFAKCTDEGRAFLSLAIGSQGQAHIGGAVFRQEEQDQSNGRWSFIPGKENERFGVIAKTVAIEGTGDYETVFELRFYGKRRMSTAGVPYIKAQVYPQRREGEGDSSDMNDCF